MYTSHEAGLDIVNQITKRLEENKHADIKEFNYAARVSIHPIISNVIYHRDNELLEIERMNTIITLARVLDDTNIKLAIEGLKFKIVKT